MNMPWKNLVGAKHFPQWCNERPGSRQVILHKMDYEMPSDHQTILHKMD